MSTQKKILFGGLGALTPIIMNLLVVDLNVLLVKVTWLALAAYLIRVVILFYLGGLVAYLHKDENSPLKLFELGVAAPALITALLNASHIDTPKTIAQATGIAPVSGMLIPSAYAQPTQPVKEKIKTFSIPEESLMQEFLRGLTGSTSKNLWFVIAGSHQNVEDARAQAEQITRRGKGFKAEVYAPYSGNPYYAVVVGAYLARDEAQQMQQKAVTSGLPKDTFVWTFPK